MPLNLGNANLLSLHVIRREMLSIPFEIDPPGAERFFHVGARGHLTMYENGFQLVYHRFTALFEMEQHETFRFEWNQLAGVHLRMSLFSAKIKLDFLESFSTPDVYGLAKHRLTIIVPRAYRDEARAAADRIQRELSRVAG